MAADRHYRTWCYSVSVVCSFRPHGGEGQTVYQLDGQHLPRVLQNLSFRGSRSEEGMDGVPITKTPQKCSCLQSK